MANEVKNYVTLLEGNSSATAEFDGLLDLVTSGDSFNAPHAMFDDWSTTPEETADWYTANLGSSTCVVTNADSSASLLILESTTTAPEALLLKIHQALHAQDADSILVVQYSDGTQFGSMVFAGGSLYNKEHQSDTSSLTIPDAVTQEFADEDDKAADRQSVYGSLSQISTAIWDWQWNQINTDVTAYKA